MRSLSGTLLTAQKATSIDALVKAELTGASNYTYTRTRILDINHVEESYTQNAKLLLDNSDGVLTPLDLKGYKTVPNYGAVTGAGDEYSGCAPLWVTGQRFDSAQGLLVCTLELKGIPDLMAEDHASENYIPDEDDTKTVKTLLTQIFGATLPCFSHCVAYQVVWDGEDSLINSYKPKDGFRIYTGGSRLAQVRRLLDYTRCVMRVQNDEKVHILLPTISGTSYNYEYSLATGHTFFSKAYRNRLVIPNYVVVKSHDDDDPQYSGYAQDAGSYALIPKRYYKQMRLESNAQATSMAEAILSKYQLWAEAGAADVPINCGAEVFDYIKVTDARQNDARTGNIGQLNRHYSAGRGTAKTQWNLTFSFGNWLSVYKVLQDIETYSEAYFSRLTVKTLYAEKITAENLEMYWLDPEGNIDSSKLGAIFTDNLPAGDSYACIKTVNLTAERGLKLDEAVVYGEGYNPTGKETAIHKGTVAPTDTTKLWIDTSTTPNTLRRYNNVTFVWEKASPANQDDLPSGTTWARIKSVAISPDGFAVSDRIKNQGDFQLVKSSNLTADGLVILAESEMGIYGLARATQLEAGNLKLTSASKFEGEWYSKSGVEIDATHGINIYGVDSAFTTRATKTGTIQCRVGANGAIYAGGGNVILNASGIELASQTALKLSYGGYYDSFIFVNPTGYLQLLHSSGKGISTLNIYCEHIDVEDKIECKRIFPIEHETAGYDCGATNAAWKQVIGQYLYDDDGSLGSYQNHDDMKIIKDLKYKDHKSVPGKRHIDSDGLPQEMVIKSPDGKDKFVNVGEMQGLMIGTFKQMIGRLETLEDRLNALGI